MWVDLHLSQGVSNHTLSGDTRTSNSSKLLISYDIV